MNLIIKEDGNAYQVDTEKVQVKKLSIFDWIDQIAELLNFLKVKFLKSKKDKKNDVYTITTPKNLFINQVLNEKLKHMPNLFSNKDLKLKKKKFEQAAENKSEKKKKKDKLHTIIIYKFKKILPFFYLKRALGLNKKIFDVSEKSNNKFLNFNNVFKSINPKNSSLFNRKNNTRMLKLCKEKMMYTFSNTLMQSNKKFANSKFILNKIINAVTNYRNYIQRLKLYFRDFYQILASIKKAYEETNLHKKGVNLANKMDMIVDPAPYAITNETDLLEIEQILNNLTYGYLRLYNRHNIAKFKDIVDQLEKIKLEIQQSGACTKNMLQTILETFNISKYMAQYLSKDDFVKVNNKSKKCLS